MQNIPAGPGCQHHCAINFHTHHHKRTPSQLPGSTHCHDVVLVTSHEFGSQHRTSERSYILLLVPRMRPLSTSCTRLTYGRRPLLIQPTHQSQQRRQERQRRRNRHDDHNDCSRRQALVDAGRHCLRIPFVALVPADLTGDHATRRANCIRYTFYFESDWYRWTSPRWWAGLYDLRTPDISVERRRWEFAWRP
jgi:hypothetical protein